MLIANGDTWARWEIADKELNYYDNFRIDGEMVAVDVYGGWITAYKRTIRGGWHMEMPPTIVLKLLRIWEQGYTGISPGEFIEKALSEEKLCEPDSIRHSKTSPSESSTGKNIKS